MAIPKLQQLLLLIPLLVGWLPQATADCNAHSPAFQIPVLPVSSKYMKQAHNEIEEILRKAISKSEYSTTSFSIAVTSSSDTLFEVHHTAKERDEKRPGAVAIDGTSCYRIASCTKAFTILALLQQQSEGKIQFTDFINQYVDELNTPQGGTLPWPEINIWSLATQMSGIPRDIGQSDSIADLTDPIAHGLPPLKPPQHREAQCDSITNYTKPCTRSDLINFLKPLLPLFPPKQQSTYSNIGYELIALALENITQTPYETLIQTTILDDLELTSTSFKRPSDDVAALPKGNAYYWDVEMGMQNPTGGLYSSTNDLSKFIRYILTHYNGITLAHNWIAPVSFSTGMNTFTGMPWEIFRTTKILRRTARPVTFVTKGGSVPGYTSYIATVPDYNFGFSILVAGNPRFAKFALETIGTVMVRKADELANHVLRTKYTGTWAAPKHTNLNSSITISHSLERSLYIDRWISNGTDVLSEIAALHFPYASAAAQGSQYLQLVPTLLYLDQPHLKGEIWRAIAHQIPGHGADDEAEGGVFDDMCITDIDRGIYAGIPLNEIGFWDAFEDGSGYGTVELTGFRIKLEKVKVVEEEEEEEEEQFLVQEL